MKGGGKGGGKAKAGRDIADTDASREIVRVMEIIGHGPMGGMVDADPLKVTKYDGTPARNADGTDNFTGISLEIRTGEPDQDHIAGITAIETETTVGVEATLSSSVVREISDTTLDAIRVKVRFPARQGIDGSGDIQGTLVEYAIDRQASGGSWEAVYTVRLDGKSSSPYERQYRVDLAPGGFPYLVRLRRISADSTATVQRETWWASYTNLIDAKLSYPNICYFLDMVNAQEFGGDIPSRSSRWRGLIVPLPANYDPDTREYATTGPGTTGGVWDLSFAPGVSDNQAWLLRELCVNKRWGAGDEIDEAAVDAVSLYEIAQFNDELVPDGKGGMEPRFTFNGVINTRQRAYDLITAIAASCGCLCYWGPGAVVFVQDRPQDIEDVFAPANVIGGTFNYESSGDLTRPTVVMVTWNDPADGFRPTIAQVEKSDMLHLYGWRPLEIALIGCTSEGQAIRAGKMALESAWNETEVVSFSVSFQNANRLAPGMVIGIADPLKQGARFGGRLLDATDTTLTLDAPVTLDAFQTYEVTVVLPDGTIETKAVSTGAGTWSQLTVGSALSDTPLVNAMWAIHSAAAEIRPFRVLAIKETEKHLFEVTALQRDPDKWARVEQNLKLPTRSFSVLPTGLPAGPAQSSLMLSAYTYTSGPSAFTVVHASWSPSDDPRVQSYEIQFKRPNDPDYTQIHVVNGLGFDIDDVIEGEYKLRVRGLDALRRRSQWVELVAPVTFPRPNNVAGFRIAINEQTATLLWESATDLGATYKYELRFTPLTVDATWANAQVLVPQVFATTVNVPAMSGTYLIKAVNRQDIECADAQLVVAALGPLSGYNAIEGLVEQPTFAGTKVDTVVVTDTLQLDDGEDTGTYTFASGDLGAVYSSRVSAVINVTGRDAGSVMSSWASLTSVSPLSDTTADQFDVTLEVRTTEDDPGGSPVWSDWQQLVVGSYTARAFEFRATLRSFVEGVTPVVHRLEISIDMPDRTESRNDVSSNGDGSGNYTFTYAYPFKVGPAVAILGQGMSTGDYWEFTEKDNAHFKGRFKNAAGTNVNRTFDWVAQGGGFELG